MNIIVLHQQLLSSGITPSSAENQSDEGNVWVLFLSKQFKFPRDRIVYRYKEN